MVILVHWFVFTVMYLHCKYLEYENICAVRRSIISTFFSARCQTDRLVSTEIFVEHSVISCIF